MIKKGSTTRNSKRNKSWWPRSYVSTSTAKPNIREKTHGLYLVELALCIKSLTNRTKLLLPYRTQLMRLCQTHKKKPIHYYSKHEKIILLYDIIFLNAVNDIFLTNLQRHLCLIHNFRNAQFERPYIKLWVTRYSWCGVSSQNIVS